MWERVGLQCLSLDHRTADGTVRGRLVGGPEELDAIYADPARPAVPAFILATCNRVELYWLGGLEAAGWWRSRAVALGVRDPLVHRRGADAARHLVRVASGLESQLLGEREITGQVRRAQVRAREHDASSALLSAIVTGALTASRRVRRRTMVGQHARSAAEAIVEWLAGHRGGSLAGCRVAVIGAGEAARGTLRALRRHAPDAVTLVNRNEARAEALAAKIGLATVRPWSALSQVVAEADVVIAATAAREAVLRAEHVAGTERSASQPLWIADLGVPKNVAADVGALPGVHLMDLDGLRAHCCPEASVGSGALIEAEAAVEHEVRRLQRELRARLRARTLASLHALGERIAREETDRALDDLPTLSAFEREVVQRLSERIARRILYPVSKVLRDGAEAKKVSAG